MKKEQLFWYLLLHTAEILGYKLGLAAYTAHCMPHLPAIPPSHLPLCMATWASAEASAERQWLLEPLLHLTSLGSRVHPCCTQAAPRVLAGHHMVGTTKAPGILHGGLPARTKRSTGITFLSRQGTETNTYCKTWLSLIWPELWMPEICFPTVQRRSQTPQPSPLSSYRGTATVAPWASLKQTFLSAELKCRAQICSVKELAAGVCVLAKAHLPVISPLAALFPRG